MANSDEYIRRAIRVLQAERHQAVQHLRRLDVKIAQLEQVLREPPPDKEVPREPGEPAPRGEAEREVLGMLERDSLTASEIAERRGTSYNAASNILRRLHKRGEIDMVSRGRYARKNGAQASLVERDAVG